MQKPNKIVLFDIDYTLFDTDIYIENFSHLLSEELGISDLKEYSQASQAAILEVKKNAGFFDPKEFLKILIKNAKRPTTEEKLENIFWNINKYDLALYADTVKVLELLKKDGKYILGILSTGHKKHQQTKILALKRFFKEEHIYIFPDKIKELETVLSKYKKYDIYLIDDNLSVLNEARKINGTIRTVWLEKQTKHENVNLSNRFNPDYTFTNLSAILSILK